MSSKISQLNLFTTISGEEDVLIAAEGSNWRVKLKDMVKTINKVSLGLDQVDNTADIDKPISTATQIALNNKAPSSHTHSILQVNGLNDTLTQINSTISAMGQALSNKTDVGHQHQVSDIYGLSTVLGQKADVNHQHGIGDVAGLQSALNNINNMLAQKADTGHMHAIGDVSGLSLALAGKASSTHQHTTQDITDFNQVVTGMVSSATSGMIVSGNHQW